MSNQEARSIGKVSLLRYNNGRQMHLWSKSHFFKNDLVVKVAGDAIVFKVATLDDRKTQKATFQDGFYRLTILAQAENGTFYFDEDESNEDQAVIYFR